MLGPLKIVPLQLCVGCSLCDLLCRLSFGYSIWWSTHVKSASFHISLIFISLTNSTKWFANAMFWHNHTLLCIVTTSSFHNLYIYVCVCVCLKLASLFSRPYWPDRLIVSGHSYFQVAIWPVSDCYNCLWCVCVCMYSGMIWTPYDWLNKLYCSQYC